MIKEHTQDAEPEDDELWMHMSRGVIYVRRVIDANHIAMVVDRIPAPIIGERRLLVAKIIDSGEDIYFAFSKHITRSERIAILQELNTGRS